MVLQLFFMFWSTIELFPRIQGQFCSSQDDCRQLEFMPDYNYDGKRLENHVIHTADVFMEGSCRTLCYMEPNCVSYNFKTKASDNGRHRCEMNNATHEGDKHDLKSSPDYVYRGTKDACLKNSCKNNATCQTGFTDKGYRCACKNGFKGTYCEKDINECKTGTHKCSAHAVCNNTKGSYNCTCKPGYYGNGRDCEPVSSCKEIYDKKFGDESKAYKMIVGSQIISVYCHMVDANPAGGTCTKGGWTLVMKINGNESTFRYNSSLWTDETTFNPIGGETGLDTRETKLPTYWNTSFSKVCLGMKVGPQTNFVVVDKEAISLFSLIADGQHRNTRLGREKWKGLISGASLQTACSKEGFNAVCAGDTEYYSKARIGIVANQEPNCNSCDSRMGFGTAGHYGDQNTCGNEAKAGGTLDPDNGEKHIKVMGFIFVQ